MIILAITQILLALYALLITYYRQLWKNIKPFRLNAGYIPTTKVSVIIPARNEEQNIAACLDSLIRQNYPANLMEVIIADDASTDNTAGIVSLYTQPCIKLIRLKEVKGQAKKRVITTAVEQSTGTLILTTDADCILPPEWIRTMAGYYEQNHAACIAAPVTYQEEKNPLAVFQALDFLSLQGITAASVYNRFLNMSNGANFAYERDAFNAVNGFQGIDQLASGDDMLLMHKIAREFPDRIHYCLSEAVIVKTKSAGSVKEFLQQRIRWASKARIYKDRNVFYVLMLVYLLNFFILALFINSLFNIQLLFWCMLIILFKTLVELIFLYPVAGFFRKKPLLLYFLPAQPFHILYTVIAGFFGQAGSYEWKGRKLK